MEPKGKQSKKRGAGDQGRAKDRVRKTLSLPDELVSAIQDLSDEKHGGDFNRAVLEVLAPTFDEAARFLAKNTTYKHSRKKT